MTITRLCIKLLLIKAKLHVALNHSHHYVVYYRFPSGEVSVDPHHNLFCLHLPHPHMAGIHEQAQVKEWS